MSIIIETKGLEKKYLQGDTTIDVLTSIDLKVNQGDFLTIKGASGSGKSTLLNILGCLDIATSGEYFLDGIPVTTISETELAEIRNSKIGFIFQGFNLLPKVTSYKNVELPLIYDYKNRIKDRHKAITDALSMVGLEERMNHTPSQLSGGQQQRVAIARALVNKPSIILADEPTGNLDSKSSDEIMNILTELNNSGITIILVTHEIELIKYSKRLIKLKDGNIIDDIVVN